MAHLRSSFAALAALAFLLPACGSDLSDCPQPSSAEQPPAAANEETGEVDSVAAEGAVDVEVIAGAASEGRIECNSEHIAKIHVETRGRTIHVWTDSGFDAPEGDDGPGESLCVVHLGVASLRSLEASGSGDVRVAGRADGLARVNATGSGDIHIEDLAAPAVQVAASGSGDIDVHRVSAEALALEVSGSGGLHIGGSSQRAKLLCNGSGDIDARELRGMEVAVLASGSGDVAVTASRKVVVDASGSGDVTVAGRPQSRSITQNGSGDIAFE